ncbi:MAG: protein-glutamate O-methyltransferase CheR, partial [Proteobacteria bacterium]|nr:protein-glutamate O-methyltransferase CheR [Pseudomonadota bacterium]
MLFEDSNKLDMSDAEYRMFCELVENHCGLHFSNDSRFLVEKRLARRMAKIEMTSFASYYYELKSGGSGDEELANLIDELTTNETYFFRERKQLQALFEEIMPEMLEIRKANKQPGPVSVWSAGCSSGEEPYTVVQLALEAGYEPGRDIRVYASDISRS